MISVRTREEVLGWSQRSFWVGALMWVLGQPLMVIVRVVPSLLSEYVYSEPSSLHVATDVCEQAGLDPCP